jgi:hypothetical protein
LKTICRDTEKYSDLHRSQEFEELCNNKTVESTTGLLSQTVSQLQFQIHYKKSNENDEADTLSKQPDHEEVKKIHIKILSEDDKEILTKGLAAM